MKFDKLIATLLFEEDEMPSREDRISAMDNLAGSEQRMFNMEDDHDLIKVNMVDNGEWEYDRLGIGEDVDGKVFLVDTDDPDEEEVVMNFCKKGLTIKDVLRIGVALKVFVKKQDGYDENDQHRWNMDCKEIERTRFYKMVLVKGVFKTSCCED